MTTRSRTALRLATALVALLASMVVVAPSAGATGNGDWSVEPGGREGPGARSSFNYTLAPQQVFRDTVTVANVSDEVIELDLYPTDALNTPLDSSFALLPVDEPPVDLGTWIELATDRVRLEPGTQAEIPFLVNVPDDATPGDHAAGIVAQNVETETEVDADGVGIEVRRRVAARVYVRVEGPLEPELLVSRVQVDSSSALFAPIVGTNEATTTFEIENVGNVRITPTVRLKITGLLGRTVYDSGPEQLKELLPGSSVILRKSLEGLPPFEPLNSVVEVTATDLATGTDIEARGSSGFWTLSWLTVLASLLIALAAVAGWWYWKREPGEADPEPPPPSEPRTKELVGV